MKKFLLIVLSYISLSFSANAQEVPEVNFKGLKPYLEQNNDSVYVINFWATWCKPCIEELPHFLKAAEELKEQKVKFIFVSLDFSKHKTTRLIPYIKEHKIREQVILLNDPNSNVWIDQVDPKWSGAIPATLIYKGDKKEFIEGKLSYEKLLQIIKSKQNE